MSDDGSIQRLPVPLARAMAKKGYESLTEIQKAVLNQDLEGRDLRLSSQTGSGKTVALGILAAAHLENQPEGKGSPQVLVVAPTRELASQIAAELSWFLAELNARTLVVTGGTNVGLDLDRLRKPLSVLVGTPGRLCDHIKRKSVKLGNTTAVILDEADEMLDMGFRDELEAILSAVPETRQTHLVSATLPREVIRLADRYQNNAVSVEGTPLGDANENIDHKHMLVYQREKKDALCNVLLFEPEQKTLVFTRTRLATVEVAQYLTSNGFPAAPINGDMSQKERTATLKAFRSNAVNVLIGTDVAARGLDVKGITRVVHFDLPDNKETFTHRSGRTGRAGETGVSISFVDPRDSNKHTMLCKRTKIDSEPAVVPSAKKIRKSNTKRFIAELTTSSIPKEKSIDIAESLLSDHDPVLLVAKLLEKSSMTGKCTPKEISVPTMRSKRGKNGKETGRKKDRQKFDANYRRFHVTWGSKQGATSSRVLATMCRRGNIKSKEIGRIELKEFSCIVDVSETAASEFLKNAKVPDAKAPEVKVREWTAKSGGRGNAGGRSNNGGRNFSGKKKSKFNKKRRAG